jgi:hypothetical protein
LSFSLFLGVDQGSSQAPKLRIETKEGMTQVWVDVELTGEPPKSHLLRSTDQSVFHDLTGADPAGLASFAAWTEGDGKRWFSFSQDSGRNWSQVKPLKTDVLLRDGARTPDQPMPSVPSEYMLPSDGRLFLVQFHTISIQEWRQALVELGAEVFQYLPHNAHIVRMDGSLVSAVAELDFVWRVESYQPWYRLHQPLREWLEARGGGFEDTVRIRVMAFEWGDAGKARIAEAAREMGAGIAATWPSGHVIELQVTRDQLRRLAAHNDVLWIDLWSQPGMDMDLVREDSGADWLEDNFRYCGQGVRGEVFDGGIESIHQDFDGIMIHGPTPSVNAHGTSTYGIVFGNGFRDGDGEAQATGLLPCEDAQGIFADYHLAGDRFAHTQELKNVPYFASFQTNSWGNGYTKAYTSFTQEIDDIIWRLDIAITQSQSNEGNQRSRPQAWAKNIIAVGGINHYGTLDPSDDFHRSCRGWPLEARSALLV